MLTYSLLDELVSNDLEVSVEPTVLDVGLLLSQGVVLSDCQVNVKSR